MKIPLNNFPDFYLKNMEDLRIKCFLLGCNPGEWAMHSTVVYSIAIAQPWFANSAVFLNGAQLFYNRLAAGASPIPSSEEDYKRWAVELLKLIIGVDPFQTGCDFLVLWIQTCSNSWRDRLAPSN